MVEQNLEGSEQKMSPQYRHERTVDEVEQQAGMCQGAGPAYVIDELKGIQHDYYEVGANYTGALGKVRNVIDGVLFKIGVTSPQERIKGVLKVAQKDLVRVDNYIQGNVEESRSTAKKISNAQMKKTAAFTLVRVYESMMQEVDEKIDEKRQECDKLYRQSIEDQNIIGYQSLEEEIQELAGDKVTLEGKLHEACNIAKQNARINESLYGTKKALESQLDDARAAKGMLQGLVADLDIYANSNIAPQELASILVSIQEKTENISGLVQKLDDILVKQTRAYDKIEMGGSQYNSYNEQKTRNNRQLSDRVNTKRDKLVAEVKGMMEAERLAS